MKSVADLWDDSDPVVRKNAHIAVNQYCEGVDGAADSIESKLIGPLIEKLKVELDEIKV